MKRKRNTTVSIRGGEFLLNGAPSYPNRAFRGHAVQGLLFNARLVQGIFDDRNPETKTRWRYPDGPFDAERNTEEFIAAMPSWRGSGLLSFTINLQGGSPEGYSKEQPWDSSAFDGDGNLREDFVGRLARILDRADELGMVVIVGYFYFGQDQRIGDEAAVIRATEQATDWLLDRAYTNVLVEIANEADVGHYTHDIIKADRCHELMALVAQRSAARVNSPAGRLLVSTSMAGNRVPPDSVIDGADYVLLHGNRVDRPQRIREMIEQCRERPAYRGQPIVFNEDDHFDFGEEDNNLLAALSGYASWGFFDYRLPGEGYAEGFQSVPVDWRIGSERKRAFFDLVAAITGHKDS